MADMIGMLPDEVLCHILSFLPTEDAVSTMLLSKRWKNLWLHVPVVNIDIDDRIHLNTKNVNPRLIYAFLHVRAGPIKTFRIKYHKADSTLFPFSDFKIWLNFAMNRGIEHLHLDMTRFERKFPCSDFNFRTLVVLELRQFRIDSFSVVDLPSLKTLHLYCITFSKPMNLTQLLNGCPVLEDLKLQSIYFDVGSFPGELKTFSKLVRADLNMSTYSIPLKALCNAEFLRSKFSEPISVLPNLIRLENNQPCTWYKVFEMLKHCPKLQILVLDVDFYAFEGVQSYLHLIPECISSQLRVCSLTHYEGYQSELQFAKYILQNSKVLRTMTISPPSRMPSSGKYILLNELSMCPRSSAGCTVNLSFSNRISTLPEEILCHILSFVPTEDAVATCLLSKRWKLLWRSVPTLDFDDWRYRESGKRFSNFS